MRVLLPTLTTALVLVAGAASAPLATAAPRPGPDDGLADRVRVSGLCDGGPSYSVVLRNERFDGDRFVQGELTVRHAGERTRWSLASEASTQFADGTGVTGNSDGFARSNDRGVIRTSAATRAGVHHGFMFLLIRGPRTCYVDVRV